METFLSVRNWAPIDYRDLPESRDRIGVDPSAWKARLARCDEQLARLRDHLGAPPEQRDGRLWLNGGPAALALEDLPDELGDDEQLYGWCIAALESPVAAQRLRGYVDRAKSVAWAHADRQVLDDLNRWLAQVLAFHVCGAPKPAHLSATTIRRAAVTLRRANRADVAETPTCVHHRRVERATSPPSPSRQPISRTGPPLLVGAEVAA